MIRIALGHTTNISDFEPLAHQLFIEAPPKADTQTVSNGATRLEGGFSVSLTADALTNDELYDLLMQLKIGDTIPSQRISIILNDVYGIQAIWWGHIRFTLGDSAGPWFTDIRFEVYGMVKK